MNFVICDIDPEPGFASMHGATTRENAIKIIRALGRAIEIINLNTGQATDLTELTEIGQAVSVSCNEKRMAVIVVKSPFGHMLISEIDR